MPKLFLSDATNFLLKPKYGALPNTYDLLKAIAVIGVIIDHAGEYFMHANSWMKLLGVGFPIFFFLIGYSRKFNNNWTLYACALIVLTGRHFFVDEGTPLNILFTVIITRICMNWLIRFRVLEGFANVLVLLIALAFMFPFSSFLMEYGLLGLMFSICGYFCRIGENRRNYAIYLLLTVALLGFSQGSSLEMTAAQYIVLFIICAAIFTALLAFKMQAIDLSEKPHGRLLNAVVMIISRNSLIIYTVHVMIFMALGAHFDTYARED